MMTEEVWTIDFSSIWFGLSFRIFLAWHFHSPSFVSIFFFTFVIFTSLSLFCFLRFAPCITYSCVSLSKLLLLSNITLSSTFVDLFKGFKSFSILNISTISSRCLCIIAYNLFIIFIPILRSPVFLELREHHVVSGISFRILPMIIFRTRLVLCLYWVCCCLSSVLLYFFSHRPFFPVFLTAWFHLYPQAVCMFLYLFICLFSSFSESQLEQDWYVGSWSNSLFSVAFPFPPTFLPYSFLPSYFHHLVSGHLRRYLQAIYMPQNALLPGHFLILS